MIKKVFISICLIMILPSSFLHIDAAEAEDITYLENVLIVDDTTLIDSDGTQYFFNTKDDRDEFLITLDVKNSHSLYSCSPGDPGYPNCSSNPVVRVETKLIKTSITDYIKNDQLLLDNWVYGGLYGATMSVSNSKSISYVVDGVGSVSVSSGTSQSFNVPAGKYGNIKLKMKFKINLYQRYWILKDGTRQVGTQYSTASKFEGAFYGEYK